MNYIIILLICIIIVLILYLFYKLFSLNQNSKEHFISFTTIKDTIKDTNKLKLKNINSGLSKYYGSIFHQNNFHNFVFRNKDNKLESIGSISNLYSGTINNGSKLYNNHAAFCLLDENGKVHCFGEESSGGVLEGDNLALKTKTIINVFSTKSAFCALDDQGKVYCWGDSNSGGEIPPDIKKNTAIQGNIKNVFSNKDTFSVIYGDNRKMVSWGGIEVQPGTTYNSNLINVELIYSNEDTLIALYKAESVAGTTAAGTTAATSLKDNFKVKCFGSSISYIIVNGIPSDNIETKDDVKAVYTNSKSVIIIYGDENKVDCCGDDAYLDDITELRSLKNIVNVTTNLGAYCLLEYDGTIHNYGNPDFKTGAPSGNDNNNFVSVQSNYGAFVGIKSDNTAIIWGNTTHGYDLTNANNNTITNVKDVYFNGNETSGSILFVKNDNTEIEFRGGPIYLGTDDININSDDVSKVFSIDKDYFIVNDNDNTLRAFGNISKNNEYNSLTPIYVAQTGIFSNDNDDINTKYGVDVDNYLKVIDYDAPPEPTTSSIETTPSSIGTETTPSSIGSETTPSSIGSETTPASSAATTTAFNNVTQPSPTTTSELNYLLVYGIIRYYWPFDNKPDNITNAYIKWNITNNIYYGVVSDKISAKVSDDNNKIIFENRTIIGDKLSISFNLYPNDLTKTFNIFTLGNLTLKLVNNIVTLTKDDESIRQLTITEKWINISIIISDNDVIIYKDATKINYDTTIQDVLDLGRVSFVIGNDSSNILDKPNFNISDLVIYDNYIFSANDIREIMLDPSDYKVVIPQIVQTTQSLTTQIITTPTYAPTYSSRNIDEIINEDNYIVINIMQNFNNIKLKTKQYNSINFIKGQKQNNIAKINTFLNSLKSITINYNLTKDVTVNKVNYIKYRGLTFTNKCYTNIINSQVSHLFNIDEPSLLKLLKLKYLDINTIRNIYTNSIKNGDIYLFITGITADSLSVIHDTKQALYFIIYKDSDKIYRFEQINIDLNYFYNVFNKNFTEIYVNAGISDNIDQSIINQFYDNLQENINQNFELLLYGETEQELFQSIIINIYKNKIRSTSITLFNTKKINNSVCNFNPSGNTLFECRQLCINNSLNNSCEEEQCNNLCNNCQKDECKWTYKNQMKEKILRPDKTKIKGFSGNKMIKITWIKPTSKSDILKYYLILTIVQNQDFIEIYSFEDTRELPEHIIDNLINDNKYSVSLISKNKMGVSEISNIETIIPNENNNFNIDIDKNTYDNSLQNYYEDSNNTGVDLRKQKSIYEKHSIIKDLKSVIKNTLKFSKPIGAYSINVY